jgi:hypothetical protein
MNDYKVIKYTDIKNIKMEMLLYGECAIDFTGASQKSIDKILSFVEASQQRILKSPRRTARIN